MNATDESRPPPPPSPPPGQPVRRLTRSTDDRILTGLSGGLGRYFGVDAVIFRIAFVVLSLAGGTGILLYLAGWLVVPDDHGTTAVDKWFPDRARKVALVVLGLIALAIISDGAGGLQGDVPIGLVLVGVGAAVLYSRRNKGRAQVPPATPAPPGSSGAPAPFVPPPGPGPDPGGSPVPSSTSTDLFPPTEAASAPLPPSGAPATRTAQLPPYPPLAAPVPKVPKERSALVPVTLSLLLVLGGVLALLGVPLAVGLAIALLATGVALVIGAWRGRARWLIPIALLLGLALCTASLVDVPVSGGVGERVYRPISVSELRSPYRLAIGRLTLDLRDIDLSGRTTDVLATAAIGEVDVIVPPSVQVVAVGHAGAGAVQLFGQSREGTDTDWRVVSSGTEGGGRLVVRARVGIGQVVVSHAAA